MPVSRLYGFLFAGTGLAVVLFSSLVRNYFPDQDLGERFALGPFYESDLYFWIGSFWIMQGALYFLFYALDKIQLIDKLTKKHYWFSLPFVVVLVTTAVLERYHPVVNELGGSIFGLLGAFSFFMFGAGFIFFLVNLIHSIYSYYLIKGRWRND